MKRVKRIYAAVLLAAVGLIGCQQAFAECGVASTYSSGSLTANGERYNHMGISAAHKSLPFGTRVVVRNQRTGRAITVRINDRGPYVAGRIIDLSTGAKNALGMDGLAPVCLEVVSYGTGGYHRAGTRNPLREAIQSIRGQGGKKHYAKARTGGKRYAKRHGRRQYASAGNGRGRSTRARHHRRHYAGGARRQRFASED
jgi:rare lipoprotein A